MVHQLVLGFEGSALPRAVGPVAAVVGDLGAAHVVHGEVGDDVVHAVVGLLAHLLGLLVHPLAGRLRLDIAHPAPHVPETIRINV